MTTELITRKADEIVPAKFAEVVTGEMIARYNEEYGDLVVADPEDAGQIKAVRDARLTVRQPRLAVEKLRKELVAGAVEYQRLVNGVAKELSTPLEALEDRLQAEEKKAETHRKAKAEQRIKSRLEALAAVGYSPTATDIEPLSDEMFQELLRAKATEWNAKVERERVAKEQAARLAARQLALVKLKAFIAPDVLEAMTDEEFAAKCQALEESAKESERQRQQEKELQVKVEGRLQRLSAVGGSMSLDLLRAMPDAQFEATLADFESAQERRNQAHKEEQERLAAEREAMEADRKKIAAERERLAAEERRLQAERDEAARQERDKVEAERRKLEAERERLAAEERARVAAEKAKAEAEELARIEAERAEAARIRAEELRPYREKVEAYAKAVANVPLPSSDDVDPIILAELAQMSARFVDSVLKFAKEIQ